jgi:hypothetical protein
VGTGGIAAGAGVRFHGPALPSEGDLSPKWFRPQSGSDRCAHRWGSAARRGGISADANADGHRGGGERVVAARRTRQSRSGSGHLGGAERQYEPPPRLPAAAGSARMRARLRPRSARTYVGAAPARSCRWTAGRRRRGRLPRQLRRRGRDRVERRGGQLWASVSRRQIRPVRRGSGVPQRGRHGTGPDRVLRLGEESVRGGSARRLSHADRGGACTKQPDRGR